MRTTLNHYGWNDYFENKMNQLELDLNKLIPGRVTEVHKEQYQLITDQGECRAKLKSSIFYNGDAPLYPTVGDFVMLQYNQSGDSLIYAVLERKSLFSRMDSFNEKEQVVAANFDYVFIMTSMNHDFNAKKLERYMVQAWQSGGMPVIVLTKSDLCDNDAAYLAAVELVAPEVPIVKISSYTREGFDTLESFVKPGKTIVCLGSSGVGKSSLVNALLGENKMLVNGIREDDAKGRHTTTYRQLVHLANDGMLIDTPGMRELGVWASAEGLESAFTDIESLMQSCKFANCSHQKEPGCGIKRALQMGTLTQQRWNSYLKLKKEIRYSERKEKLQQRAKEKVSKIEKEKTTKRLRSEFAKKSNSLSEDY